MLRLHLLGRDCVQTGVEGSGRDLLGQQHHVATREHSGPPSSPLNQVQQISQPPQQHRRHRPQILHPPTIKTQGLRLHHLRPAQQTFPYQGTADHGDTSEVVPVR